MKRDNSRIVIGAVVGIIVMAVIDYLSAKVTNSIYAIPVSVFLGAMVAGYIAKVRAWIPGLIVGVVSSGIGIGIAYYFLPQMNTDQLQDAIRTDIQIVSLNIICGVIGGLIGGYLVKHMNAGLPRS